MLNNPNFDISTGISIIISLGYQMLYVVLMVMGIALITYLIILVRLLIKKVKRDMDDCNSDMQ